MFDVGYADFGADDGACAGVEVLRCSEAHPEDGLVVAYATIFGHCLEMWTLTGGNFESSIVPRGVELEVNNL
jgi:hypothetical protein